MKKRIVYIVILFVCVMLACLISNKLTYKGPVSDLLDRVENELSISIEFDEIVYYKGTEPGPFGEGDELLVITVTEKTAQTIQGTLIDKDYLYSIVNADEFKSFLDNDTFIKNSSNVLALPTAEWYGIYSKVDNRFLTYKELINIESFKNSNGLNRYFLLQYDIHENILSIRSYS